MDDHTDSTTLICVNYFPRQVDMKLGHVFLIHILYVAAKIVVGHTTYVLLHSPEFVLIQSLIKVRKLTFLEVSPNYVGTKMFYRGGRAILKLSTQESSAWQLKTIFFLSSALIIVYFWKSIAQLESLRKTLLTICWTGTPDWKNEGNITSKS